MKNVAVIFAGGVGVRMNTRALPKQFIELHKKPILIHTIDNFEKNPQIDGIIIVMVKEYIDYTYDLIKKFAITKVKKVVAGGDSGQQSILIGLKTTQEIYQENVNVLIHDGVRPLISQEIINNNIDYVNRFGNAITCAKMNETTILNEENEIADIVDRRKAWIAKAPQSFRLNDILAMHQLAIAENKTNFVDSCSLMKYYNHRLYIVECNHENIKVTTPIDYYLFRAIFEKNENEQLL